MRHSATIALLLVALMNTMATACVADSSGRNARPCKQHKDFCRGKAVRARGKTPASTCAASLKAPEAHCGLRSFVQSHFAESKSSAPITVQLVSAASVTVPDDPLIIISSIGSPHTDRGPPRS
jgi:hypothetical protein